MIETERLVLHPLRQENILDVHELTSTEFIQKYNMLQIQPLEQMHEDYKKEIANERSLYLESKDSGRIIGNISLERDYLRHGINCVCISYWLDENCTHKGYMREAMQAVIDYCFVTLQVELISARVFQGNDDSVKLLNYFGFVREGVLKHAIRKSETIVYDDQLFAYYRSGWEAMHQKAAAQ